MNVTAIKSSDVDIDSTPYERDHGAKPRGNGSWAFCAYDKYRLVDYLPHVYWVNGSFGEARRAARQHFAKLGVSSVVVCS